MQPEQLPDSTPRPLPRFFDLDRMDGVPPPENSRFNTGFREWLRKMTAPNQGLTRVARDQVRVEEIKKLLGELLTHRVASLSKRDLRLYLRLMSAARLEDVRELRFECFDLLCRTSSEPAAVLQLDKLDALLKC